MYTSRKFSVYQTKEGREVIHLVSDGEYGFWVERTSYHGKAARFDFRTRSPEVHTATIQVCLGRMPWAVFADFLEDHVGEGKVSGKFADDDFEYILSELRKWPDA